MIEVVEGAVGLAGLEARPEEHRAADEFILNRARSQTAALGFNLYLRKERKKIRHRQKWASLRREVSE